MVAKKRDRANVFVGAPDVVSGAFSIGKVLADASKFPKDASADLATEFAAAPGGYVGEDGLSKTVGTSTEKIKAWSGDPVLVTQTDHSVTLKFKCLESANLAVLKMIAGEGNVSQSGNTVTVVDAAGDHPSFSLDFRMLGGQGAKLRVFAPECTLKSVGEVKFTKKSPVAYDVEVECLDVLGDGKKAYTLFDKAEA